MAIPASAKVVGGVAALVLGVVGVVANSLTLVAIGRSRKLRRQPTTILMLALTTANLVYCGVNLPLTANTYLNCWFCYEESSFCTFYGFFHVWIFGTLCFLQAALAVNRWTSVCKSSLFSLSTSIKSIIVCCLVPPFLEIPPTLKFWGQIGWDPQTGLCIIMKDDLTGSPRGLIMSIGIGVPFIIIAFCYCNILRKIRTSRKRMEHICPNPTPVLPSRASSPLPTRKPSLSTPRKSSLLAKRKSLPTLRVKPSMLPGEQDANSKRIRFRMPLFRAAISLQSVEKEHSSLPSVEKENSSFQSEENEVCKDSFTLDTKHQEQLVCRDSFTLDPMHQDQLQLPSLCIERPSIQSEISYISFIIERDKNYSNKSLRRRRQELGLTLTVGVICMSYLMCTVPSYVLLLMDPRATKYPQVHIPTYILHWMTGLINPLVYVACNRDYRKAFKITFNKNFNEESKSTATAV